MKMRRLITLVLMAAVVCCVSCKKNGEDGEDDIPDDGGTTQTVKKYAIGSYYDIDGIKGIVYKISSDSIHGMIVSLDESSNKWATNDSIAAIQTGATDPEDGANNITAIKGKNISDYPAFKWCNDKNSGTITGWYLPASYELSDIYQAYEQLQDALTANSGTAFSATTYWSSTEVGSVGSYMNATAVNFDGNRTNNTSKNTEYKVRAVHTF